ncbi:MAG TPA: SH3 domain-containing protein [Aestuariivirgaceae bacterium]|nr:SH3 domain-containing protein [Aestuariivirgaceae bacterium]
MERPGLLELAVYALLLTGAAGWVYALPPFTHAPGTHEPGTHEPGTRMLVADIQPASGEAQGQEPGAETASVSRAIGEPPVAPSRSDAADPEPRPDPQPNLLVVTARSLNMRSEPNAGSALVGSYPRGARVEEVEKTGNWILVRTEDKVTGWMYAGYLGSADE